MRRWAPAAVASAALVSFAPVLRNGFVGWDDGLYITENPLIGGLGLKSLGAMLTATRGGLWQPLSWLSLAADRAVWGLDPFGFHLTALLLHAASSVLFYFICLRLLEGKAKPALLAALFFAVHPLRVESVAWATERKGLLSAFFFLLAFLAYLHGRLRSALAAFALALCAKATALTFPLILLIHETYRARRRPDARALRTAVPFFALSAGALLLGVLAARVESLIGDITPLGASWRVARVLYGLLFYPLKTLWPAGLSAYYPPLPWFDGWSWPIAACALAVGAATAALWRVRRTRPELAAIFAAYAVMMLPTVGLIQQGQLYAACDRFSYLSCLGFALLFGAGLARGRAATALAAVWLLALGASSWRQCAVWRDSYALWSAAQENAPGALALGEKGAALLTLGRTEEGISLLREATEGRRPQATAFVNLGVALSKLGREEEARAVWRRGLAASPSEELAALLGRSRASELHNRANALAARGRVKAAEALYREALRLDPALSQSRVNLGNILARRGDYAGAAGLYRAALKIDPRSVEARANLDAVTPLLRK